MSQELLSLISATGMIILMLFFWIRGIKKSCKSDLVGAVAILVFACANRIAIATTCEFLTDIGIILFIFGVSSILLSRKAQEDKGPIRKSTLRSLGILCCCIGFIMTLHV